MKESALHRGLAVACIALAASLLLLASGTPHGSVSARATRSHTHSNGPDDERRVRQADLKIHLASTHSAEFQDSLTALAHLDEQGALDVWRIALSNADPRLRRQAWSRYREVQSELSRKEFVPQIARINAPAAEVSRLARSSGLDVTIWSAGDVQTIAAAPPYLIERLRNEGLGIDVIYDSVAAWQKARANGDSAAQAITPQYQSTGADSASQIRVAVIDLADRGAVAAGYSDWLGDREDILMRDGSRLAYLDIFLSDGSPAAHRRFSRVRVSMQGGERSRRNPAGSASRWRTESSIATMRRSPSSRHLPPRIPTWRGIPGWAPVSKAERSSRSRSARTPRWMTSASPMC